MKNKVEKLRKEKRISQESLASILNVSRQTVSSIETGKYNPSLELAFKIANYFEKTIEDIFEYKGGKLNEEK